MTPTAVVHCVSVLVSCTLFLDVTTVTQPRWTSVMMAVLTVLQLSQVSLLEKRVRELQQHRQVFEKVWHEGCDGTILVKLLCDISITLCVCMWKEKWLNEYHILSQELLQSVSCMMHILFNLHVTTNNSWNEHHLSLRMWHEKHELRMFVPQQWLLRDHWVWPVKTML